MQFLSQMHDVLCVGFAGKKVLWCDSKKWNSYDDGLQRSGLITMGNVCGKYYKNKWVFNVHLNRLFIS